MWSSNSPSPLGGGFGWGGGERQMGCHCTPNVVLWGGGGGLATALLMSYTAQRKIRIHRATTGREFILF